MTARFHPEFARDVRKYSAQYEQVSNNLRDKFRTEIDLTISSVKIAPLRAGHLLSLQSKVMSNFRRSNLRTFPFFVLYSVVDDQLFFGAVIPSRSDPLTWLVRFAETR